MALRARRVTVTDEPTLISGTPDGGPTHGVEFRLIDAGTIEIGEADLEYGSAYPWSDTDGVRPITTGNAIWGIADTSVEIEVAVLEDDGS